MLKRKAKKESKWQKVQSKQGISSAISGFKIKENVLQIVSLTKLYICERNGQ